MRTGNKILFCSPRIKILAYQQLFVVRRSSLALSFVLVQELVFAGCFFRFAPYGRALVWARCGYMPHKPLGTDQTAKCGKMWPVKRKQKAKCYFAFCALISKSYQMPFLIQNVVAFGYPRQLPQPLARMRLPMRGRQQIIPLCLVFILRGAGTVRIKIPHH